MDGEGTTIWRRSPSSPRGWSARLAILALAAILAAASPAQERVDPEPGDHCLLCGRELVEGDLVELYRGRRVPVCSSCEAKWEEQPHVHFARLQPRSALFQERDEGPPPLGGPWFWLGVFAVTGLVSSAASAYLAVNRGQPPVAWFFAGLVGNVAALLVLVFVIPRGDLRSLPAGVPAGLTKVPETRAPRPCTGCGAPLHPTAGRCRACGASIEPLIESEVEIVRKGRR